MMALTTDDRETVRLIAKEIAGEFAAEMQRSQKEALREAIDHHAATCSVVKDLFGAKRLLVGALMVFGVTGGGGAAGAMIVKWLLGG